MSYRHQRFQVFGLIGSNVLWKTFKRNIPYFQKCCNVRDFKRKAWLSYRIWGWSYGWMTDADFVEARSFCGHMTKVSSFKHRFFRNWKNSQNSYFLKSKNSFIKDINRTKRTHYYIYLYYWDPSHIYCIWGWWLWEKDMDTHDETWKLSL